MKRIKPPKIHRLRTMVARNFSQIGNCCGTEALRQICSDCNVRLNMMGWALNCLARVFAWEKKSINFKLKIYWKDSDDRLYFKMRAKTTKEIVYLEIAPLMVLAAREWGDKITESARQSDKEK